MQTSMRALLAAVFTISFACGAVAQGSEPTVIQRVEGAVKRGASAAERGIEKGVGVAASGVKRGASAAEYGARKAGSAVERTAARIGLPASGAASTSAPK